MEMLVFIVVIACVVIMAHVRKRSEDRKDAEVPQRQTVSQMAEAEDKREKKAFADEKPWEEQMTTLDFFLAALDKMGSPYEIYDDDDEEGVDKGSCAVLFRWQGEIFTASLAGHLPFVAIWQRCWREYDLDDVDELSRVRRAVNTVNSYCYLTVYYEIDETDDTFTLNSKRMIMFPPNTPDTDSYLSFILDHFFEVNRKVLSETDRLRIEEESVKEKNQKWAR